MTIDGIGPTVRGFGVFFDPSKTTSGQRFFQDLSLALSGEAIPFERRPTVVLFNVSASIKEILRAKWRGQMICLRIDGMYFDRLSPQFIASFNRPMRALLRLGTKGPVAHDRLAFIANLIDQNYGAFARILLADRLIYQSVFSQEIHSRYFPNKPFEIVVNGSVFRGNERPSRATPTGAEIRLVTTYDDWKPAKRVHDLLAFVQWAREVKRIPVRLTVLGYTGNVPACAPPEMRTLLESTPYVETMPRFKAYEGSVRDTLFASDLYITFTHKDPCPNTVVEAMAHGLPVVGVDSGGVPDIVGDAGILVPEECADAFFTSYRHECEFPPIDFTKVLAAVVAISSRREEFEDRVAARFAADLNIDVVAGRYACVLRQMAGGDSGLARDGRPERD